ncbi:hypothetical protein PPERSA_06217 [Pseudocohnilembus persalinus]|uniref:Uncharacterized protein n=1 Tax=Pseudocohnilembus persalinus TaxID=266149 RepID=A0A0V0R0G2_PSEPJ|nr:hypothetical protein PPERSA_06217 [Pseudocohnilembus persalinus]|eukprot:KRX08039.1 hypothetical protein PPERSA_06217 [Pseudocohnilembus persalinus]
MEEKKKKNEQEKISSQPFYEQYFITILEIIEDKPNFLIPIPFYCIIIVVYYCQICGYILSHYESKPLKEELFGYVAYLNEVSPITFLLYMKGLDALTLLCYFLMQFIVYFYFSYVGVLSILKNKFPHIVQKFNRQFQMINQVLNIFFTFFWWMFFTPYIEINSGMIVCGDNSFLVEYRFTDELPETQLFYPFAILGVILSGGFLSIINYKFRNIMNLDNETFPKYYKHMDFYLEEIQRLIQMQSRDEQCKFQLFVLLQHHKQWCTNEKCACQIVTFISQNNDINEEEVYKLIDSLFLWALKHPLIKNNNEEFEHLSLKYISYIGKYRNNPYRAYYELKSLLSNRNNVSFYFKTISRILSKNLEFMIDQKYSLDADSRGDSQYLNTDLLLKLQNVKSKFIPLFAEYMKMKHEFWEKTKNGYITMDKFMEQCLILSKKGVSIKKERRITNL